VPVPTTGGSVTQAADVADARPDLARGLRALRKRAGLTQAQAAAASGVSLSHFTNLEAGALPRHSEAIDKIINALNAVIAVIEAA
jgi:transcriptional regulator with XRE-family HTH domain